MFKSDIKTIAPATRISNVIARRGNDCIAVIPGCACSCAEAHLIIAGIWTGVKATASVLEVFVEDADNIFHNAFGEQETEVTIGRAIKFISIDDVENLILRLRAIVGDLPAHVDIDCVDIDFASAIARYRGDADAEHYMGIKRHERDSDERALANASIADRIRELHAAAEIDAVIRRRETEYLSGRAIEDEFADSQMHLQQDPFAPLDGHPVRIL